MLLVAAEEVKTGPCLWIPDDADQHSETMSIKITIWCRSRFRRDADHKSGRIGTVIGTS